MCTDRADIIHFALNLTIRQHYSNRPRETMSVVAQAGE